MTAEEFVRLIRKLGRSRGVPVSLESRRGKGSHIRLTYGNRFTMVKDRRKQLGPGLLASMLRQLGLTRDDIR